MEYITHTEFNGKAICGEVNLPIGTALRKVGNMLYLRAKAICVVSSETAYKHFTRNDDDNGLKRGELIQTIKNALSLVDEHRDERWDRVWEDEVCAKFNKNAEGDTWLWNVEFYNAEIADLEHIADLVTDEDWKEVESNDTQL